MKTNFHSLTYAEIQQFHDRGYLGPLTAFSPAQMASFRDIIYEKILPPFHSTNFDGYRRRHLNSSTIFQLCSSPAILDCIISLLGSDIVLWGSNLFEKPPQKPEAYPWHQDSQFWKLEPMITVSAWLAITPATHNNGCVEVIPGSHHQDMPTITDRTPGYTKRFWGWAADPNYFNESEKVPLVLDPGQFFLFRERTLHRSGLNQTQTSRLGLGIRFTIPSVMVKENIDCILLHGSDSFGLNTYVAPPTSDSKLNGQKVSLDNNISSR